MVSTDGVFGEGTFDNARFNTVGRSETATVNDVETKNITLNRSETSNILDQNSKLFSTSFSESAGLQDVNSKLFDKNFAETISLTDSTSFFLDRTAAQTISATDNVVRTADLTRSFSENTGLADESAFTLIKQASETISLQDLFNRQLDAVRDLSETLTPVTDPSNPVTLEDGFEDGTYQPEWSKHSSFANGADPSLRVTSDKSFEGQNSFEVYDVPAGSTGYAVTPFDGSQWQIGDTVEYRVENSNLSTQYAIMGVSTSLGAGPNVGFLCDVSLGEAEGCTTLDDPGSPGSGWVGYKITRTGTNTLHVEYINSSGDIYFDQTIDTTNCFGSFTVDEISYSMVGVQAGSFSPSPSAFFDQVTYATGVPDRTALTFELYRGLTESFNVADQLSKLFEKPATETVQFMDNFERQATLQRSLSETFDVLDTVIAEIKLIERTLTESFSLTDSVNREVDFERTLNPQVVLSPVYSREVDYERIIVESATVTTALSKYFTTALQDGFTLADVVQETFLVEIEESFGVSDTVSTEVTFRRVVADAFSLSDNVSKRVEFALSQATSLTDAASKTVFKTLDDSFELSDFTDFTRILKRTFTESVTLSDEAVSGLTALADAFASEVEIEKLHKANTEIEKFSKAMAEMEKLHKAETDLSKKQKASADIEKDRLADDDTEKL